MNNIIENKSREEINIPPRKENEKVSDYLLRLDKLGRFLFHGSPYSGIDILEPRQAIDIGGDQWGNDMAVYAVPAVIAVGRAILPKREKIKGNWSISSSSDVNEPKGPLTTISQNIKLGEGSVYIVDKTNFISNPENNEWKSKLPIKILKEIMVKPENYTEMGGRIKVIDIPKKH